MEVPDSTGGTVIVRVQPLPGNQLKPSQPDISEEWDIMENQMEEEVCLLYISFNITTLTGFFQFTINCSLFLSLFLFLYLKVATPKAEKETHFGFMIRPGEDQIH